MVHNADDPLIADLHSDRYWAEEIGNAMTSGALLLYGQPIRRTRCPQGTPAWFEILLRYQAEDGSIIAPGRLLNAAARFGLSEQLDAWVLDRAVAWLADRPTNVNISVNVTSPFAASPRSVELLGNLLSRYRVDPRRLCLEITESTAIEDLEATKTFIRTAQQLGSSIAIDDFGSGWTTLPVTRELGVELLKIDGSWIQKSLEDPLAASVVTSTVAAANIIGVEVVAEWVENRETLDFVHRLGVEYVQGFFVGQPAPLSQVEANLKPRTPSTGTLAGHAVYQHS